MTSDSFAAERLATLLRALEAAPAPVALTRGPRHEIEFVNRVGRELLERPRSDPALLPQRLLDTVVATGRPRVEALDGAADPLTMAAIPTLDSGGAVQGVLLVGVPGSDRGLEARRLELLSRTAAWLADAPTDRDVLLVLLELIVPEVARAAVVRLAGDEPMTVGVTGEPARRDALERAAAGAPLPDGTDGADLRTKLLLDAAGARAIAVLPIEDGGRRLGSLALLDPDPGRLEARVLEGVRALVKDAAVALRNARALRESRRAVRAREDLLAVVSHDLKNPLTTIVMAAALIQRTAPSNEEGVRTLKQAAAIQRAAIRMENLVRDLLDLARLDAGQAKLTLGSHSASALATHAIEILTPQAIQRSVELLLEVRADAWVRCDRDSTLRCLENVLGNAVKFSPERGSIRLIVDVPPGSCTIAIVDGGPGIPRDQLGRLFERFWQAEATAHMGTGLGLSIARGIAQAQGGKLTVESEVGKGSTFTLTLPLA